MDNKIVIHGPTYDTDNEQRKFITPFQRNTAANFIPPERDIIAIPTSSKINTALSAIQCIASLEQAHLEQQFNTCVDILSQANLSESISAILSLGDLQFQRCNILDESSVEYQYYLKTTINDLNYILYDKTGSLQLTSIPSQQYDSAKVITDDFLKPLRPDDYKEIVEKLALLNRPGFAEVHQELTQGGIRPYFRALGRGISACFSYQESSDRLRKLINGNDVRKDLIKIKEYGEQFKFLQAKAIVEKYDNAQSSSDKKIADIAQQLYLEYIDKTYDLLIERLHLTPSQELKQELRDLIPYIVEKPAKAAELFYEKLEQYKNNEKQYGLLQQLINKVGLPKFYSYDRTCLNAIEIPTTIRDSNHIKEQQTLFSLATCPTHDKEALALGMRYVVRSCQTESSLYTHYAKALLHSVQSKDPDTKLLKCTDFTQTFDVKAKQDMIRRMIPAICNITNEINQLKQQPGSEERIKQLQSLRTTLHDAFQALDDTASKRISFNKVISEAIRELNVLNRSEMILTKSQEDLRALLQSVDLLYTGKTETHNLQVLQKLQPQSSHAQPDLSKTYEQYLMRETLDNKDLWTEANDSLRNEVIKHYIASSQDEALQEIETIILNRDTNCTIAKNIFTVIQDSATIIATDFPLKEIGDYAHETITHPTAYLLNIAKDFAQLGHFLKSFVSDYAKNNIASLGASKKDAYEFSKKYNEAVHKFAEGWKNLSLEHKKEFVAKLIVDLAANKALGIGAKLISNIMGDCIISFVDTLPPSISGGGAVAITRDIALMPELVAEVAEVIQAGGAAVGSTSVAVGSTGIQGIVTLYETTPGKNSKSSKIIPQGSYELPIEKFKAYTTIVEDGNPKIIESTFSTEEALEILNNSSELKMLNSRIEELKKATQDIRFGISDERFKDVPKLYEKAMHQAEQLYERARKNNNDIQKIAYNIGISEKVIEKIKNHIFIEEHILGHGNEQFLSKFLTDIDIAESWERLINGNFVQSDLILLQHELTESLLMQGTKLNYGSAHYKIVNKIFNWNATL